MLPFAAFNIDQGLFALAGIIFLITILRIYARNRTNMMFKKEQQKMAKKPAERYKTLIPAERNSPSFVGAGVPDAIAKWEVEMHNLGREITGQIDTKLAVLQTFTENAERAALQLETLIEQFEQLSIENIENGNFHSSPHNSHFAHFPRSNREKKNLAENTLPELPKIVNSAALFGHKPLFSDDPSDFSLPEIPARDSSAAMMPNPEKTIPFPKKEKSLLSEEALKAEFDFEKRESVAYSAEKTNDSGPRLITFPKATQKEVRSIVEKPAHEPSKNEFTHGPRPQFSALMDDFSQATQPTQSVQAVNSPQTQPIVSQPKPPVRPEILNSGPQSYDSEPQMPFFPDLAAVAASTVAAAKAEFAQAVPESVIDEESGPKIRMLANYGYSAKDISYQLNLPEQEVERHLRTRATLASG